MSSTPTTDMTTAAAAPAPLGAGAPGGATLQLALATGAFAVCFAIFGSVSAMMPILRETMGLSDMQRLAAIAVPVLLGSLGRIPLGILTDRYGGRIVFIWTMAISILPAIALGWVRSYWLLLAYGFVLGLSLASFAVGVGFVSRWYPPRRQGTALGIYGAGNIGQSLANFLAPAVAGVGIGTAALGARPDAWGFWLFALLTAVWLVVFIALAKDVPAPAGPRRTLRDFTAPLASPMSWILSLYYFLTFGGFVAMAGFLPTFLTHPDTFRLTPLDANLRTAGFVVLATLMRPVGGSLADHVGGRAILLWVFPLTGLFATFLACPLMSTITIGALGMAICIGLGNGAVFKLVPEYFPKAVGSVTGLVGASGGLGGFFPPLLVGIIKQTTGSFIPGFVLLGIFALACFAVALKVKSPGDTPPNPAATN
jgi:NNP family nitrate/nitrite transporter-like MFS transporter